jgi:hypothetical protein
VARRSFLVVGALALAACSVDETSGEDGQTVTNGEGESGAADTGSDTNTETGGDASCLDAEDPGDCCEAAGPELEACQAAGCWDVEQALSFDDQCDPIELGGICFPAVWEGMCLGTAKPDGCALSPGDEVVYRELSPGQYVYLVGFELCLGGVPGWTHCFADPESDPPGCACACA